MKTCDCSVIDLRISVKTRMQCIHGCQHYKRHMNCPPLCPDDMRMHEVLKSYNRARICYEKVMCDSAIELSKKHATFHLQLLEQERALRESGAGFALAFASAPCNACEGGDCRLTHCHRPHVGRMPICATGIEMDHFITDLIGLEKEDAALFWRGKLSEQYFRQNHLEAFFVGVVLY